MIRFIRIMMSVLGAAATPALIAGVYSYRFINTQAGAMAPNIAQAVLSVMFGNALMIAVLVGIPLFYALHRWGRLNALTVLWTSACAGFVVLNLYGMALYGIFGAVIFGMFFSPLMMFAYMLLAPAGGLTALFVWKTFPLPDRTTEASHA